MKRAILLMLGVCLTLPLAAARGEPLGDPEAAYQEAMALLEGGTSEDEQRAMDLLRKAAGAHHPGAELELAFLTSDPAESVTWLEDAAGHGNPEAQYNLGVAISQGLQGLQVTPDPKRAATLFRSAADQRFPPALYNLAMAYLDGVGVPRSVPDACGLLIAAVKLGLEEAREILDQECSSLSMDQKTTASAVSRRYVPDAP